MYPKVIIKNKRVVAVQRRHPWIFSGAIAHMEEVDEGGLVEVRTNKGDFLCIGYYHSGSIAIRVLTFEQERIDQGFWTRKVNEALLTRQLLGLPNKHTNAFRLIHGEGDGLPGLIVDVYHHTAVIQCHTLGMLKMIDHVQQAILDNCPFVSAIYLKSAAVLGEAIEDKYLTGQEEILDILENGHAFQVDLIKGQKTGFFLDQRDNRKMVGQYASGKKLLNLYAYTGGFSIYALNNGAEEVVSVDISRDAVEMMEKNVEINHAQDRHEALAENVHEYMKSIADDHFDIIVLDPPAFAKSQKKRHNAVQAYKRINAMAMQKVKSGGLLFTFSCSQVVDPPLFYHTVTAAAMEVGRTVKVLHRLSQGGDHPVSLFHPEGEYLKGLVIQVV